MFADALLPMGFILACPHGFCFYYYSLCFAVVVVLVVAAASGEVSDRIGVSNRSWSILSLISPIGW
jgi:hypothetical protein